MKNNMGLADRIIRVVLAVAIVILYVTDIIAGTLGIILLILAGVFVLTSFLNKISFSKNQFLILFDFLS